MGAQGGIESQILYTFFDSYAKPQLEKTGTKYRITSINGVAHPLLSEQIEESAGVVNIELIDGKVVKATVI